MKYFKFLLLMATAYSLVVEAITPKQYSCEITTEVVYPVSNTTTLFNI